MEQVFQKDIIKGKITLITGGATGINFGIAEKLGKHGAKLILMGRRANVLESSVNKLRSQGIEAVGVSG